LRSRLILFYLAVMDFDYAARITRLRSSMEATGVDAVLLSVGPDLPYFTGYEAHGSERLTMLAVTEKESVLAVPRLEAAKVEDGPYHLAVWDETDDPVGLVASVVGAAESVAIGDQTWSVFMLALQERLPDAQWSRAGALTAGLRVVKDAAEIEALSQAAAAADRVAARLVSEARFSGRSERAVSRQIGDMLVEEGHDEALFAIVASGANGASPHHDASSRIIDGGDMVVCDFGGSVRGYRSDTTRTFVVGDPTDRQAEVHLVVLAAQEAARRAVGPGVRCEDVDRAARGVIVAAGLGDRFLHRTGHGIGLDVHEDPYLVEGNETPLAVGMAFSIEPGVYIDGEFGVRIEDIVVCGPEGAIVLNQSPRELLRVD
jgi:Xaa-Pro aminopeptidase